MSAMLMLYYLFVTCDPYPPPPPHPGPPARVGPYGRGKRPPICKNTMFYQHMRLVNPVKLGAEA